MCVEELLTSVLYSLIWQLQLQNDFYYGFDHKVWRKWSHTYINSIYAGCVAKGKLKIFYPQNKRDAESISNQITSFGTSVQRRFSLLLMTFYSIKMNYAFFCSAARTPLESFDWKVRELLPLIRSFSNSDIIILELRCPLQSSLNISLDRNFGLKFLFFSLSILLKIICGVGQ